MKSKAISILMTTSITARDDFLGFNIEHLLDLTDILEDCACRHLSVDEPFLCDDESFSLQDAMAASQLLDRKMDSCEVSAAAVAPWGDPDRFIYPRPIPSSLNDPLSPLAWDELTVCDVAFISLEIIVRIQSLLSGSSVGESTFTCLYAHSAILADMETRLIPETLCNDDKSLEESFGNLKLNDNPTVAAAQWSLFASVIGLIEITEIYRGIVLNADIYEEEDFSTNTHNIIFYSSINSDAQQILKTALQILEKLTPSDEISVIRNCLGFQVNFLLMCTGLSKLTVDDIPKALQLAQNRSREAVKNLQQIQAASDKFKMTETYSDAEKLYQRCFDAYVIRPLVGNLPVRKIRCQDPDVYIPILSSITAEVDTFVCNLLLQGSSLGRIQRMLDLIGKCNILSRSLMVLNLYFNNRLLGQFPLRDLIANHVRQWQSSYSEDIALTSEYAEAFLNRLSKPLYDCLKMRLLNRNRQRAYIEGILFPEWSLLQNEAQMVDMHCGKQQNTCGSRMSESTPPTYFTRFVLSIVIYLMDRFVASGIEVGLFHDSHHDLAFAFWYRDFLLNGMNQNQLMMHQSKESATCKRNEKPGKGKKKYQKKNSSGQNDKSNRTVEDMEDDLEVKFIALMRSLCRRTLQFRAALYQANLLKDPRFHYTSLKCIFAKRFEVFQCIRQPPLLTYENYRDGNDFSQVSSSDLIQTVLEGFQHCRSSIDQLLQDIAAQKIDPAYAPATETELRGLFKVCIGNAVYAQKLRRLVDDGDAKALSSATVTCDFDAHDQFCIFKIT